MFKFSLPVISLLLAGSAAASVLDIHVCGTGLAADCKSLNVFTQGATDIHYALIAVPTPPPGPGPNAVPGASYLTQNGAYPIGGGAWMDNDPKSAWIAPTANQADKVQGSDWPTGHFIYRTTFIMPTDFASALITGQWATDNSGVAILLNGNDTNNTIDYATGGSYGFQHFTPFTIDNSNSWFHPGVNNLDFVVANGNNADDTNGPSGLRVEIDGATYVSPEPATFVLLLFGLPVALYLKRKGV